MTEFKAGFSFRGHTRTVSRNNKLVVVFIAQWRKGTKPWETLGGKTKPQEFDTRVQAEKAAAAYAREHA